MSVYSRYRIFAVQPSTCPQYVTVNFVKYKIAPEKNIYNKTLDIDAKCILSCLTGNNSYDKSFFMKLKLSANLFTCDFACWTSRNLHFFHPEFECSIPT